MKTNYTTMKGLFCFAFVCQANSVPFLKTLHINYKLAKRRSVKFVNPLYNNIVNYDIYPNNYNSTYVNKNIRINYKLAKKKSNRLLYKRINLLIKNENEIIDKSMSFIGDNIVNELLYMLKFYNLTNDNVNIYIYIIVYELLWIGYKVLRINTSEQSEFSDEDIEILYQQVLLNILMYVFIKNMFMNIIVNKL